MITDFYKSTGYSSYGENARFPNSLARQHIEKICIEEEEEDTQSSTPPPLDYNVVEKSVPPFSHSQPSSEKSEGKS